MPLYQFTKRELAALAVALECWMDEGCPLHYCNSLDEETMRLPDNVFGTQMAELLKNIATARDAEPA